MGPPLGGRRTFWIVGHVARQYSSTSARMVKSKKAKVDVELADVEISDGFSKPIEQVGYLRPRRSTRDECDSCSCRYLGC